MTVITEADNGKAITLTRGAALQIRLPAQSGTGYRWQTHSGSTAPLKLETTTIENAKQLSGGPVTAVLNFQTTGPGHGVLKLSYRRSWETTDADRSFSLSVTV